jgi:Au+-exporting ATPase
MAASVNPSIPEKERKLSLPIEGMTCASCVSRVERVLARVPGVSAVSVNLATERAEVRLGQDVDEAALSIAVEKAGYRVGDETVADERSGAPSGGSAANEAREGTLRRKVWMAAAMSAPVLLLEMGAHWVPAIHHWVHDQLGREASWGLQLLLTAGVMLGPGRYIFVSGFRALVRAAPDMNSLVALGTTSAFAYSLVATLAPATLPEPMRHVYFEAAAVVITLILLGRFLEAKAKGRTSEAISRLVELAPAVALVQRNGEWCEVNTRDVAAGDVLLIKPGARIAVDGVVREGESHVDESMLTGEPVPVRKQANAPLHAGTVNQSAAFTMVATAIGEQTLLAQIVRLVEQAQSSKLPIQALVDRVTAWFVPVVMGLALATFVAWLSFGPEPALSMALVNAVGVLIIACPCAMGLATPTSILVGTGRGAELGVLFRHGEALQRLREANVVAMDKTGTLTVGRPELTDWFAAPGFAEETVLAWAAAIESRSEHPIARAIVVAATRRGLPIAASKDVQADVGRGVRGRVDERSIAIGSPRYLAALHVELGELSARASQLQADGKTTLAIAVDGVLAAVFAVSDPIKPSAAQALSQLAALGVEVVMITGDNAQTARAVAKQLGIERVIAEVLPAGKVAAVEELKRLHGTTAFVGDGINDAPVLAAADVGIALGAGTDIAIEAAQVVLMRDDLTGIPAAVALSRATLRNIRQNLFWAFAYNAALIPLAAGALYPGFGLLLSPVLGGLAMAMSSVFVLGNALRLRRFSPPRVTALAPVGQIRSGAR